MHRNLLYTTALLFLFTLHMLPAPAREISAGGAETAYADDAVFQEYKGRLGKWIVVTKGKKLSDYASAFDAQPNETEEVNRGLPSSSAYRFIPYGRSYIEAQEKSGHRRTEISASPGDFIWPVADNITISSVLGFRGREFHMGIDIPASSGSVIRAAMDGQVVSSGFQGGYGNVIDIQHRNSFLTRYAHNTVNLVKPGDFVKKGQTIALAGSTGRSTGSHLHFEIRCCSIPLDPMDFLPDADKVPTMHRLKNWKAKNK